MFHTVDSDTFNKGAGKRPEFLLKAALRKCDI